MIFWSYNRLLGGVPPLITIKQKTCKKRFVHQEEVTSACESGKEKMRKRVWHIVAKALRLLLKRKSLISHFFL